MVIGCSSYQIKKRLPLHVGFIQTTYPTISHLKTNGNNKRISTPIVTSAATKILGLQNSVKENYE